MPRSPILSKTADFAEIVHSAKRSEVPEIAEVAQITGKFKVADHAKSAAFAEISEIAKNP